jgi:hypothetical protein
MAIVNRHVTLSNTLAKQSWALTTCLTGLCSTMPLSPPMSTFTLVAHQLLLGLLTVCTLTQGKPFMWTLLLTMSSGQRLTLMG